MFGEGKGAKILALLSALLPGDTRVQPPAEQKEIVEKSKKTTESKQTTADRERLLLSKKDAGTNDAAAEDELYKAVKEYRETLKRFDADTNSDSTPPADNVPTEERTIMPDMKETISQKESHKKFENLFNRKYKNSFSLKETHRTASAVHLELMQQKKADEFFVIFLSIEFDGSYSVSSITENEIEKDSVNVDGIENLEKIIDEKIWLEKELDKFDAGKITKEEFLDNLKQYCPLSCK